MTTEVLFTPTPSSSSNGQQVALICGKGGEQFANGVGVTRRSRRNHSVGDNEMPTNCQRIAAPNGRGRRTSGDSENTEKDSPKTIRSPRCEAFVMTGEKMLSLNPKISPCYAKVCQNQLPPTVEVESPPREQQQPINLFDAFPSMHRQRGDKKGGQQMKAISPLMVAQSDELLEKVAKEKGEAIGDNHQQMTTNNGGEAIDSQTQQQQKRATEELGGENKRTEEEGEETTMNGAKRTTKANGMPSTSLGTMVTPLTVPKGIYEPSIRKKHRMVMTNDMDKTMTTINGESQNEDNATKRNAIGKKREKNSKQHESAATTAARADSSKSIPSSDILTWTNSQQSVTYPAETIARMARHLFTRQIGLKGANASTILVKKFVNAKIQYIAMALFTVYPIETAKFRDEFSLRIASELLALFNFAGLRADVALRDFLAHVQLCGDTFEREQLLDHFSRRYYECNPTVFNSADDVQLLASALLLLSTDLHGKVGRSMSEKAMSCREFIDKLSNLENNKFDKAMLRELYVATSERPFNFQMESDETEGSVQSTSTDRKHDRRISRILSTKLRGSSTISELRSNSLAGTMVDPEQQVDYKHGWLLKKSIYDSDGKRTPFGRRKWMMHYVTVRGMVLYLHQNEQSFSSVCRYVTFRNCILLHHAFAEPCRDYTKRRNVFRLRTAQLGESLFQTSESAEVQCWCDAINYVAAAFSTPALPTPVGANGSVSFYRPNLPSTATHLSIPDQLRAHEQRMEETALNLARLREEAPPINAKGRVVHEYFYKERFLETEKNRYSMYISILREKLTRASSVLRCGESFTSNALFSYCKMSTQNNAIHSTFGETSHGGRPCSSVTSQMDDELLDEDGITATTTASTAADIGSGKHPAIMDRPHSSKKSKGFHQHQNQLRLRANT